jgi:catechol-2,3-dioxygenase
VADPNELQKTAPIAGLSHAQLNVTDIDASADWYLAALGLERQVEDRDAGYVALRHRGAKIVIVLTTGPDAPPGTGPGPDRASAMSPIVADRVDHLAFAVRTGEELEAWAHHLADIGIAHPGVVMENGNPSLQLRDPDGIAIELVAPGPVSNRAPTARQSRAGSAMRQMRQRL